MIHPRLAPVLKTVFLFMCFGASLIYILVAGLILMALWNIWLVGDGIFKEEN